MTAKFVSVLDTSNDLFSVSEKRWNGENTTYTKRAAELPVFAHELYREMIPAVLQVELKRGEQPTPFSEHIHQIRAIYGIDYMIQILTALGKDPLQRGYSYYSSNNERKAVLSHLLKVCMPKPEETADDLKEALKGADITRKRPDEQVTSVTTKYTPLPPEELKDCYQFIQKYKKESRQFGAQRRASEGRAVEIVLRNLSVNAGFTDVTRLVLRMEGKLAEQLAVYFEWRPVEDVELMISVDEYGKSTLKFRKNGKLLKSIPAKYKKSDTVKKYQDVNQKLKEQYSRTKQMMGRAMEDGTVFESWEILELYLKLDEELEKGGSRLFSGNQIQPKKTAGALRGRRWAADYEDGLQKIYYKENIAACIYAMADWFTPSDIEAPTLEWVAFSDRKKGKPVKIKDIPDVVYSEVMRDVDLAVSVAHAGGVDPETSHSTIEMRRAVAECSMELFGIKNVRLEGNFAIIDGKLGRYSVHLGSGVVHQAGNAMLFVVPVHSQHRGRLFLPFIDDDPKTAEIMSKTLLFAEDTKIKDPNILSQIR